MSQQRKTEDGHDLRARELEQRIRLNRLYETVERYCQHDKDCELFVASLDAECTCGLRDALKRIVGVPELLATPVRDG